MKAFRAPVITSGSTSAMVFDGVRPPRAEVLRRNATVLKWFARISVRAGEDGREAL
jgi:hypothetical protein